MINTLVINSESAETTEAFGEDIGRRLKGGEVIELKSDLGGGKTTFTRGLVRGAGSHDHVASPTFTISKVYKTAKYEIHHFDFYRLQESGLMEHELHDLLGESTKVVVVEWGDVIKHVLPDVRLTIEIIQTNLESREIHIYCPPELAYLLEDS